MSAFRSRWTFAALAVGLGGCSVAEFADGGVSRDGGGGAVGDAAPSPDDAEAPPDDGPEPCGRLEVEVDGRCVPLPPADREAVCAYVTRQGFDCTDADGDCYPGACTDLPAPIAASLLDCDDARPQRHPRATELCNGGDDDCDADVDEDYDIGSPCVTACGDGKTECSVDDPRAVACTTAAGQSEAAAVSPEERCNGRDDDCDGRLDEDCSVALGLQPTRLARPALCGTDLYVLVDGALVHAPLTDEGEAPVETLAPAADAPDAPACGADVVVWRALSGECAVPADDGPERCVGRIMARWRRGSNLELASLGEHGRPVVVGDHAVWHTHVAGQLTLQGRALDAGTPSFRIARDQSDPTPLGVDRVATREWTGDRAAITLQDVAPDGRSSPLAQPTGRPGRPAAGRAFLAWNLGATSPVLWVAPTDDPLDGGFQLTTTSGPQLSPRFGGVETGDVVVWLDAGGPLPRLRALDLGSRVDTTLAVGAFGPDDFAVGRDRVVFIEASSEGPKLRQVALPGATPGGR